MHEDLTKSAARFDLKVWRGLWPTFRSRVGQLLVLVGVMAAVGLLDATFPFLSKYAIDNFIVRGTLKGFSGFIVIFLSLIAAQSLNTYFLVLLAWRIENGFTFDLRNALFSKLQSLSLSFFDNTQVGFLMSRVMSDVQRISTIASWQVVDFTWALSTMVFVLFYMFLLSWRLALFILLAIPPLAIVSIHFQRRILERFRTVRKMVSELTGKFNEHLMGVRTIKYLAIEAKLEGEVERDAEELRKNAVSAAAFSALYTPIVIFIANVVTGMLIVFGGGAVARGSLSVGTLVAAVSYSIQFFEPIQALARILAEVVSAQASAERIVELLGKNPEISDEPEALDLDIDGNVEFENVSFGYKIGETVLKNFSLKVRKGEKLAIVGETGAGKTTLVSLLGRFYEPLEGRILIDGVDYRRVKLSTLRRQVGFVLQTPHLFNDTVAENIRYGRLDASFEEVVEAAKTVNAHEFILKLEDGYDTIVGEGGSKLSAGQRQLISLARIVLLNPKIIVLDEATSSIDTYTEHLIQEAIDRILHGRTSFIIAHRLSTVRNADWIIVLENGRIVEQGTHQSLMKARGKYYRLYMKQFVHEKEAEMLSALGAREELTTEKFRKRAEGGGKSEGGDSS